MINAERINCHSPYIVVQTSELSVHFATKSGVLYEVGFTPDYSLGIEGVYQFYIQDINHSSHEKDELIRDTVWAILEDFFFANEYAMLYICDVNDGRQDARNRLFKLWFTSYAHKELYKALSAEATYLGESYYATLIVKATNPLLQTFANKFKEFEENVNNKIS